MAAYKLICRTCDRVMPHNSPGVYLNEQGQKCRNLVCDFCGTSTVHRVEEEKEPHEDDKDHSEQREL